MLKVAETDRAAGKREIEESKTVLAQRAAEINSLTEDVYKLTEWLKDSQQRFSELRSRFPVRVMKKLKLI